MSHKRNLGKTKYASFIILIIMNTSTLGNVTLVPYNWAISNDKYNCIVGIALDNKPLSSGVIVRNNLVLASANPIERLEDTDNIKIYTIDGAYNKRRDRAIIFISRDQAKRNSGVWFTFGFDGRHAPHHDLIFITMDEDISEVDNERSRFPTMALRTPIDEFLPNGKFKIAGFGFIDRVHVKQNINLEIVVYPVSLVIVDCYDWFPPTWGVFICLRNIENFVGISSGALLFYNDVLVGIGCFSIRRGSESLLVFTDYRKYMGRMYYHYRKTLP